MHLCGSTMMGNGGTQVELCSPLQQLKEEHIPLRKQMEAIRESGSLIGKAEDREDWTEPMRDLHEKVSAFFRELDLHSQKEEDVLFPMMAKYIGREVGPIAVMEYEHDTAKKLIHRFLESAREIRGPLSREEALQMADDAVQAEAILSDHFMKEENVLFPMAEQMLLQEEKDELLQKFAAIK